jgi:short-subunit dehydrogenase
MSTALITGATAGIGAAFAHHLAARGDDVVLVARDAARLRHQADVLSRTYSIDAEVLPADLSTTKGREDVVQRLSDRERPVDLLINNAGFTTAQRFVGGDLQAENDALDVMVRAVMELSHAALGPMVERDQGALITVSSVAGWIPGGTYSAAKAWATSFTEGLATELEGTGVQAMALCPGFVHTEFHERAGIDMAGIPEALWLDAPRVVADALSDLERGRRVSVPGPLYKGVRAGLHVAPAGLVRRISRARRQTGTR